MSGTGKLATEYPKAGVSDCGTYTYSLVVFDPGELRKLLKIWLRQYCDNLKAHSTSNKASAFKEKFRNDFGITIP
jgi:ribosomal protein L16 Arg81 hydroxylase